MCDVYDLETQCNFKDITEMSISAWERACIFKSNHEIIINIWRRVLSFRNFLDSRGSQSLVSLMCIFFCELDPDKSPSINNNQSWPYWILHSPSCLQDSPFGVVQSQESMDTGFHVPKKSFPDQSQQDWVLSLVSNMKSASDCVLCGSMDRRSLTCSSHFPQCFWLCPVSNPTPAV